jgi:integrase
MATGPCSGVTSTLPSEPHDCGRSRPSVCAKWHAETAESSRDQAAKGYRLLRAIWNTALADGLIGRNPCTIRGAGIEHAHERPMLDTTTVLEFSEAIEARLRRLVLLGGFAGMRSGELIGLQRRDVDRLHGTVASGAPSPRGSPGRVGSSLPPSRKPAAARSHSQRSSFVPSRTTFRTTWKRRPIPSSSLGQRAPAAPPGSVARVDRRLCRCRHRGRAHPRPPAPCHHRDRS